MQRQVHQPFICVKVLLLLLLLGQINQKNSVQAVANVNLCTYRGSTLNHECTVNDTHGFGSTIWQGEAFKCLASSNQIALSHSGYKSGVDGACGNFSAMSVGVSGSEYTSRITIHVFNEATINCTLGGAVVVETIFVRVGTLPPPPDGLTVTIFPESSITVIWSPPSGPVEGGVDGYLFGVTGDGCGCVSMNVSGNSTSVTCSGWTTAGQTCFFEVRTLSQDCGLASNPVSSAIRLSVPSAPHNLVVEPIYKVSGKIQEINVNFTAVDAPFIGTSISPNVTYSISLIGQTTTLQFTDFSCDFNNYCTFLVNGFDLSNNEQYLITVTASNVIGSGNPTIFSIQIPSNIVEADIVGIIVDITTSTVYCLLLGSYIDTPDAVCSIIYGYPQGNCERYTDSSVTTTGRPGVNLTIPLSQDVNIGAEFCYTVSLKYGVTTIKIIGNFTSECDPNVLGFNSTSQHSAGSVSVNNGEIVYDGVTPGSTAHLVCDKGYAASQETRDRTCLCNGLWSGKTQICEEKECDPGVLGFNPSSQRSAGSVTVNNGVIVYDGLIPGSTAHLVCNEGYTASEETRDRICLNSGEWSEKTQICKVFDLGLSKKYVTDVTISTVVTFLLASCLGVSVGVINVLGWRKCCCKPNKETVRTHEVTVAPNVFTEDNPSYCLKQHIESSLGNRNCAPQLQRYSMIKQGPNGPYPVYEDPDILFAKNP